MEADQKKPVDQRQTFVNILIVLVLVYFGFLIYQSVYSNYEVNNTISQLKKELNKVQSDQRDLQTLIAYYQTESFRELEARKKLGMRKPGEKVIVVEVPQDERRAVETELTEQEETRPNYILWLDYISGKMSGY